MNRTGLKFSPQDRQAKQQQQQQQQQKQKKRLSFRDPEVEGPQQQQSQVYGGCRPKALIPSAKTTTITPKKENVSERKLSIEEQALQIAQSVGSAFPGLNFQSSNQILYDSEDFNEELSSALETDIKEYPVDNSPYERKHSSHFKLSPNDEDYLETDLIMRCPTIEPSENLSVHNSIPTIEPVEEKYPSSAQHQIQLLKYQLDQQNHQTQMALHQVQLLTDQMEAECAARHKAQEQNNQLMMQNQDFLNHIEKLFRQIEELERQLHLAEQGKKVKPSQNQEQRSQPRTSLYMGTRRLSSDQISDSKTVASRGQTAAAKSSLSTTKPTVTQLKATPTSMQPNTLAAARRSSLTSPKPFTSANTLHIGDTSPPVQTSIISPFSSSWRLKSPEPSQEMSSTVPERTRTGSFSSLSKLKPPEINTKASLFGGSNSSSATSISSKKYSSSTSDLYDSNVFHSRKPSLTLEDTSSSSGKSSISNVNTTPASKLPRYQAYTGWQRRSSLTKGESEQITQPSKERYKLY